MEGKVLEVLKSFWIGALCWNLTYPMQLHARCFATMRYYPVGYMNIEALTITPRPFFDISLIYPTHKPRGPVAGVAACGRYQTIIGYKVKKKKINRYEQPPTFASMARIRNFRGTNFHKLFLFTANFSCLASVCRIESRQLSLPARP